MKKSVLFWEGAQWARDVIGGAQGEQRAGICERILKSLGEAERPPDYVEGVRALIEVAVE